MARRSDHTREELESLILDKAWAMVGRGGFEGLTARKIGEAVGYAPGTLYNVFGSMDGLYLAVNGRTLDQLFDILSSGRAGKNPIQNMKAMAIAYRAFCRSQRPYWLMLFTHHLPDNTSAPQWYQDKIERLFKPLEELLTPLYPAHAGHERKMAARILWSSVHGLCFLEQTGKFDLAGRDMPVDGMIDTLIDTFIKGIKD